MNIDEIAHSYWQLDAECPEHGALRFPEDVRWTGRIDPSSIHTETDGCWFAYWCRQCDRIVAARNAPIGLRLVRSEGNVFVEGGEWPDLSARS